MKLKNETISKLIEMQDGTDIIIRLHGNGDVTINNETFSINKDFDDVKLIEIVESYIENFGISDG